MMRPVQPVPRLRDPQFEARLELDGYAIAENFLPPPDVGRLLELVRAHDAPIHHSAFGVTMRSPDLAVRTAVDRGIKEIFAPHAERVFNGYRHCFSNFLVKEPQPGGQTGEVPLHQDTSFVDETRYQSLGVWCPLVDTDLTNGCLTVLPGSHRLNTGPRALGAPHPYRDLDPVFARHLRALPMKAGDAMIFCQKLFHGSPPNRGRATRHAAGALFVPNDAQLLYYYLNPAKPSRLEVYAVDDLFYTRFTFATRPQDLRPVAEIDYWYEPIRAGEPAG